MPHVSSNIRPVDDLAAQFKVLHQRIAALERASGDMAIVLTSPDGTRFALVVSDAGVVTAVAL